MTFCGEIYRFQARFQDSQSIYSRVITSASENRNIALPHPGYVRTSDVVGEARSIRRGGDSPGSGCIVSEAGLQRGEFRRNFSSELPGHAVWMTRQVRGCRKALHAIS
jgi:hypothetical protein